MVGCRNSESCSYEEDDSRAVFPLSNLPPHTCGKTSDQGQMIYHAPDPHTLRILRRNGVRDLPPEVDALSRQPHVQEHFLDISLNGPYAPFGFESIEQQLWRNKQNDRSISDSEIKAVLSQLFKTDQWLPPAGHVSEDVTSHA
ncbi:hypothetical protein AVEN_268435-1 [Araneus ventricosus]|uniref:Uncharacterized protein n=1 Tax=Araneus ventricosus TaxID=182803 RepID=A0A4Y2TVK9_ARAVE|nr:hypothetical protein AVEN_268435-1 [Araneus ventricosus]